MNNNLTYHQWLNALNSEIKSHSWLADLDITNYPLFNFRALYLAKYTPEKAYIVMNAMAAFVKHGCVI